MEKTAPKISIVTPSFNQANFLEATINSVLSQNYPNLEYVIIDGGSTDGSVEIIKRYENHLHYWCSEPDGGQYAAINKGFSHTTGGVMAWLNSDDMYCPWAFRTVVDIMSELPSIEWLTTSSPVLWDWSSFCIGVSQIPGYSREAFLDGRYVPRSRRSIGWIQQESTFWRRSLWEKIGENISTKYKFAGDFDLWSRFYLCSELYSTSSPLGGFRSQLNQKTSQIEHYTLEAKQSLDEMREKTSWKPNFCKEVAVQIKLHRIPKIRALSKLLYCYYGKRVVRRELNSPRGFWETEEYPFYQF